MGPTLKFYQLKYCCYYSSYHLLFEFDFLQSSKLTDAKMLNACKKCQLRLKSLEQGKILEILTVGVEMVFYEQLQNKNEFQYQYFLQYS